MAIPGLRPQYEVRAKVRIGEKKTSAKGNQYPSATDHFICPDEEFLQLAGTGPKSIRVRFPHDEPFTSGMEWWRGKQLTCYSKGDGKAFRVKSEVRPDDTVVGQEMGRERLPILCRFRECPLFGKNADNKACRVMGRLIFFLDGGRTDSVLEIDTKAWNSIERLEAAINGARQSGSLIGRVFELSVEMVQKGRDRFPVLSLKEADVAINDDKDWTKLNAVTVIERLESEGAAPRVILAAALDVTNPDWRENPQIIDRIREVGADVALATMRTRLVRELAQ